MGKKAKVILELEFDTDEIPAFDPAHKTVNDIEMEVVDFVVGDRYWLPTAIQKAMNEGDEIVTARYIG
jgi:hypothetical protein